MLVFNVHCRIRTQLVGAALVAALAACGGRDSAQSDSAGADSNSVSGALSNPATHSSAAASSRLGALGAERPTSGDSTVVRTLSDTTPSQPPGASFVVRQLPNGQNLYVAPAGAGGNDGNDGSRLRPFATLQRAAASVTPGTTVWINGGVYNWPGGSWLPVDGTADNWVVVRPTESAAGQPDSVVIRGDGQLDAEGPACIATPGSYLDLRNLICDGFGSNGFLLLGAHHVRVLNSTVRNMGNSGIAIYKGYYPPDPTQTPAYQIVIEGNTITNTNARWRGTDFRPPNVLPPWGQGISAFGDDITIRNNRLDSTYGEGIGIIGMRIWAVGNTITNSCSPNLYLDTTSESLIERNLVAHNNPAFFTGCPITNWSGGQPMSGSGIQVAAETDTYTGRPQPHLRNNTIRNNIIINTRQAFFYGSYAYDNGGGDGMKGMRIINNTFVGGTQALLALGGKCADAANPSACNADPRVAHEDTEFANNIFYWTAPTNGNRVVSVDNGVGIAFRNNLWFSIGADAAAGLDDVNANPRFANAGGSTANDFRLTAGSAAIGKGSLADVTPFDYFGSPSSTRKRADIGAVWSP